MSGGSGGSGGVGGDGGSGGGARVGLRLRKATEDIGKQLERLEVDRGENVILGEKKTRRKNRSVTGQRGPPERSPLSSKHRSGEDVVGGATPEEKAHFVKRSGSSVLVPGREF